jgi:tyrosine-specific transport protein
MDKKDNRLIGGILLVAGTATGAGMLALPVITSFGGFIPSIFIFLLCWCFTLISAFFFLEVNLAIRGEPNLVSMAGKTLGFWGKAVSWFFYLLLLYALLAAYIAGCSPLFESAFKHFFHVVFPSWFPPFALPFLFGGFVYLGTKKVDYLNRILMLGLVVSYFLLIGYCPVHVQSSRFLHIDALASLFAVPIVVTSFGYHIIIPTLTTYLNHDVKRLRLALLVGSSIPFVIYLLWQWIVIGSVSLPELTDAWREGLPATAPLSKVIPSSWVGVSARFFSFFAIVTSFLGVSLSLSDFLTDGLRIKKTAEGRVLAVLLTFVPPLLFVFTYQKSFYVALEYAGVFVSVLLGILPSLMVLKLKQSILLSTFHRKFWAFLSIVFFASVILLNFLQKQGMLDFLIEPYLE